MFTLEPCGCQHRGGELVKACPAHRRPLPALDLTLDELDELARRCGLTPAQARQVEHVIAELRL